MAEFYRFNRMTLTLEKASDFGLENEGWPSLPSYRLWSKCLQHSPAATGFRSIYFFHPDQHNRHVEEDLKILTGVRLT